MFLFFISTTQTFITRLMFQHRVIIHRIMTLTRYIHCVLITVIKLSMSKYLLYFAHKFQQFDKKVQVYNHTLLQFRGWSTSH